MMSLRMSLMVELTPTNSWYCQYTLIFGGNKSWRKCQNQFCLGGSPPKLGNAQRKGCFFFLGSLLLPLPLIPFHTLICYLPLALIDLICKNRFLIPWAGNTCAVQVWLIKTRQGAHAWLNNWERVALARRPVSFTILLLHPARLFFGMQYICLQSGASTRFQ